MMRLMFYWGRGDLITKVIRLLTDGKYSHVELQFTDKCRFFSTGHGVKPGTQMVCEGEHDFGPGWDKVGVPSTKKQESATELFAFTLIGFPFDWCGLWSFVVPFADRDPQSRYCSSIVLKVLQQGMDKFPGHTLKVSPNGLYRLFRDEDVPK